jgi:hypothetical protein
MKRSFFRNLTTAIFSGLSVGLAVGLVLGLKVSKINPSITNFHDTWILTSHLMGIYGIIGICAGAILGILAFFFLRRKETLPYRSLWNFYFPVLFLLTLFHYFRQFILTHFIANPLLPVKGSLWLNIGFTLLGLAGIVVIVIFALKLLRSWKLGMITAIGSGAILLVWIIAGIVTLSKGAPNLKDNVQFQDYTVKPTGQKVALIGMDALWWEVMHPLMQEGKLPNFQRLIENGSSGELKTLYPTYSAMIWTSIATGKFPQKHGINSFLVWTFPLTGASIPLFRLPYIAPELLWMQERLATVSPTPSTYRTASAIWNAVSDKDLSVGVIGWFASWPADKVNGYMFTDRALFSKLEILTNVKQREGTSSKDIYPPELYEELLPYNYTPQDIAREDLSRFVNVENDAFWEEFQKLDTYNYLDIAYEASMFKFSFPGDKTVIEVSKHLLQTQGQPDLWAVYLQGMDSMQHQYLKYYFGKENEKSLLAVNIARYKDLVSNYYQYMDQTLGEFLALLEPHTIVIVVSDHGFDNEMLSTGHYHHIKPSQPGESEIFHLGATHPGVFIVSGSGVKKGFRVENASVLDIAPTALAVMGFPFARDFDGKVLADILENPITPDTIPTFDQTREQVDISGDREVDKAVREKLKALGYVK